VQQGTESAAQQDIKSTAQHARARAFRAAQRRAPQPPHQAFNQTPQHLVSACYGQPLIPTAQLSPAARRPPPPPLPRDRGAAAMPPCRAQRRRAAAGAGAARGEREGGGRGGAWRARPSGPAAQRRRAPRAARSRPRGAAATQPGETARGMRGPAGAPGGCPELWRASACQ
jgi:hypothetical protein